MQAEVEALFRKLFRKRSDNLDPRQLELVFEAMRDLGISRHDAIGNAAAANPLTTEE